MYIHVCRLSQSAESLKKIEESGAFSQHCSFHWLVLPESSCFSYFLKTLHFAAVCRHESGKSLFSPYLIILFLLFHLSRFSFITTYLHVIQGHSSAHEPQACEASLPKREIEIVLHHVIWDECHVWYQQTAHLMLSTSAQCLLHGHSCVEMLHIH